MKTDADAMEKVDEKNKAADPTSSSMKYWSLIILVFQNASLILVTRYSRTVSGDKYITSTAVLFAEVSHYS